MKNNALMSKFLGYPPFKRIAIVAAIAGAALGVGVLSINPTQSSSEAVSGAPVRSSSVLSVSLAPLVTQQVMQTLNLQGMWLAENELVLSAQVSGLRLTEILVEPGQPIKKGQLLAKFDSSTLSLELEQLNATMAEAKANENLALATYRRIESASSGASPQELDQAAATREQTSARVQSLAAQKKLLLDRIAKSRITAPFDGVASQKVALVGATLNAGAEVLRMYASTSQSPTLFKVQLDVPARHIESLKPGQIADITYQGESFSAQVRNIAPALDAQKSAVAFLEVDVSDANAAVNALAKAGDLVQVSLNLGEIEKSGIPASSVLVRDGSAYVATVPANTAPGQAAPVQLLKVQTAQSVKAVVDNNSSETPMAFLETVPKALADNPQVISEGVGFLSDGDLVTVAKPAEQLKGGSL